MSGLGRIWIVESQLGEDSDLSRFHLGGRLGVRMVEPAPMQNAMDHQMSQVSAPGAAAFAGAAPRDRRTDDDIGAHSRAVDRFRDWLVDEGARMPEPPLAA